jgi:hypothetical protein
LLAFVLDYLPQESVQTSCCEPSLLLDGVTVLVVPDVAVLLLHHDEVLLSVRPDLCSTPCANELLNAAPVFSKQPNALQKLGLLFLGPSSSYFAAF